MSSDLLRESERIVAAGGDADDVLRAVVSALAASPAASWAEVRFREGDRVAPGPSAGTPDEGYRSVVTVAYGGDPVGELAVDGDVSPEELEQIATVISPFVLLGWDTGGAAWEP
jgi:hypothetical protein